MMMFRPDTCADIIEDFTPPSDGSKGPPRRKYWAKDITLAHERAHFADFRNTVSSRILALLKTFVDDKSNCTTCKSLIPERKFEEERTRLENIFVDAYNARSKEEREAGPHQRSNELYRVRVESIRQRARAEPFVWPTFCQ